MNLKLSLSALALSTALLSACASSITEKTAPAETNQEIATRWMNYLADDARKGRATGSTEIAEVKSWLQSEYQQMGLQTLPNTSSYFQEFEVNKKDGTSLPAANLLAYIDCQCDNKRAVMIGAHYDHIGTNPENPEDTIFNGADDDASGVVASMLVARELLAMQKQGKKLPFNIILGAWDAEELGLLGSKHFVENPLFPLSNIETGFMFELVGVTTDGKKQNAWMSGSQYSSLFPLLKAQFEASDWELEADPFPQMALFMRSDNAPFALMDFDREKQIKVFREKQKVEVTGLPLHGISVWRGQKHYHQAHDEAKIIDIENLTALAEITAKALSQLALDTEVEWLENPQFDFIHYKESK